jgi:tetratricopeptide (TPR) repeat protein
MKKKTTSLIIIIFIIFPFVLYSKPRIELESGANFINMGEYNSSVDAKNKDNESGGFVSKLEKAGFSTLAGINAGFLTETDLGLFGFYLKNNAVINYGSGGNVSLPGGTDVFVINRNLIAFYSGLQIKKYFLQGEDEKINAFVAVDGGFYYSFSNNTIEKAYNTDGSFWYETDRTWSVFYPGGGIETGVDWHLSENYGLNLKAGYRFGLGKVLVNTKAGLNAALSGTSWNNTDYSGLYVTAGTSIYFSTGSNSGSKKLEYEINEAHPYSNLAAQFYNDGVKLFEKGLYDDAEKKFIDAQKLEPENKQIKEYLDRLKAIKENPGSENTIEKKLEIADKLRSAGSIRDAYLAYKEALAMDPQNKQAVYYMEIFAEKSAKLKAAAESAYSKNNLKKALKNIDEASEYAPDDMEINGLKDKITAAVSNKKETDRLFNEGVENFQKSDYNKALKLWEKATELSPDDKEIQKNIKTAKDRLAQESTAAQNGMDKELKAADELYDKGVLNEARSKYEYILRLDAGNTKAAEMIKKIDDMEKQNNDDSLKKR